MKKNVIPTTMPETNATDLSRTFIFTKKKFPPCNLFILVGVLVCKFNNLCCLFMGTGIFFTFFFVFFVILNFEKVKILNGLFHKIFKKHVQTTLTWGQSYKTFHSCNLQILEISVCPWQAFPAKSNVCR